MQVYCNKQHAKFHYILFLFSATVRKPMDPVLKQSLADFGQVIKDSIFNSLL